MIRVRKSCERGHVHHGWLSAKHSFSFGTYYDSEHMGYHPLVVINQDQVEPKRGFAMHPHRDMEIISYIIKGTIEHKDSMGHEEQIHSGQVQVMTAGSGIKHSEFNPDNKQVLELLQIWIEPSELGLSPSYAIETFSKESKLNQLKLIVSSDGEENSLTINRDIKLFASLLEEQKSLTYEINPQRKLWLQVISGKLKVNEQSASCGDGVAIKEESFLKIESLSDTEFLLFDLEFKE